MRLFVSLPLPEEQRAHLATALAALRTTAPERWHVTLAFLGEQPDDAPLVPGLAAVAARTPPFALQVQGGGTFPGVLWAGVAGDVDALRHLAHDVAEACRGAGVVLERRPFRAHTTVARGRVGRDVLADYDGPRWTVTSFDLVRSTLGREVRHEVVHRFSLTG